LANFSAELTLHPDGLTEWTLYVDGSSNKNACSAGIILEGPSDLLVEQALQFAFKETNNQAEYEAILAGLNLAHDLNAREVTCKSDSQFVVGQIKGDFEVKNPLLQHYYHTVRNSITKFDKAVVEHIRRQDNKLVDTLSCLASTKKQSHHCSMIAQDLYRKGYSTPLLKCLTKEQNQYVLREIHDGACGNHSGVRTMVAKVIRVGYYWPTVQGDCAEYVKKYLKCQEFGLLHHSKPEELHKMSSP